ncbi:pectinesterase family protein [Aquibacillus kalidii]|uniref:pectinesterase family protein n=1 Tax=Aquibacillus kalidii TaxID=2762597 RepID=UPI001648A769|nr:pectinesterase family protein [Aquibacillus kalidii]
MIRIRDSFKRFMIIVMLLTVVVGSIPYQQNMVVNAESLPEMGETYNYDFSELKIYDKDNPIDTLMSSDGLVKYNGNGEMYHHGDKHGLVVKTGNSFEVAVAGSAKISFVLCQYSDEGTISVSGGTPGSELFTESTKLKVPVDGEKANFYYSGSATTLTFTVSGKGYVHGFIVENLDEGEDVTPWVKKDFSLQIGQETVDVHGAATKLENASTSMTSGSVYYSTSESAYISTDLNGEIFSSSILTNLSPDVVGNLDIDYDTNEIVVTFADQATNPREYRIKVQDTSVFVTPNKGDVYNFDFAGGAIPTNGLPIDSYLTDDGILKVAKGDGDSPYWHDSSHGMSVLDENYVEVKVAGDADIIFTVCEYGNGGSLEVTNLAQGANGTFDKNELQSEVDGEKLTYSYTGEATTLRFTLATSGENYLHGITVKNKGKAEGSPIVEEQASMPNEIDEHDSLNITANGYRLQVDHTDSEANIESLTNVGYFVFDGRSAATTMEADIEIKEVGNSSENGVFFGLFEDETTISKIATVGIRGDNRLRNVYSKKDTPSIATAGSMDIDYAVGDVIHLVSKKDKNGWHTEATINSETTSVSIDYEDIADMNKDKSMQYGFAFANVNAVITNLILQDENGKTLYDQKDTYEAVGAAPTVTSVGQPAISTDRTTITVTWSGDRPEGDGAYAIELSTDGGKTYTTLDSYVMDNMYTVDIEESGTYKFRVYGKLGDDTTAALESVAVEVLKPLASPELAIDSGDSTLTLNWNAIDKATSYEIYRKSSEQADYTLLGEVKKTTFVDAEVVNETPYYYYLVAKSAINSSNGSEPVLSVPSAGRVGKYVLEKEATDIVLIKKSYDTVYTDRATLQGVTNEPGLMELVVNGEKRESVTLKASQLFNFLVKLKEGRNDVNLYFTDNQGNVTRKTFNFVYLTSYDMVVDATYTGVEGAVSNEQPSIKQFSTVQAAVDAVPTNNKERVVILVKEGAYFEHLRVNSPYISLIGEDRDMVNIQFYDPVLSPEGGSTSDRNATYIKETATGFSAENLTFENTYQYLGDGTKSNESADAIRVDADKSTFVNVKMLGYQDTLYASSNRQYYYKSYILGNVDFIYGSAQALFDDSDIVFRYNAIKNSGYVTAPKTASDKSYGFIFKDSRITAEAGASGDGYLLARPWGADAAATFINTYMSEVINKDDTYNDMSGNLSENARFYEYYTYGKGFSIHSGRPQISKTQAEEMLLSSSLGWDPLATITENSTSSYVGKVATESVEKYVETEWEGTLVEGEQPTDSEGNQEGEQPTENEDDDGKSNPVGTKNGLSVVKVSPVLKGNKVTLDTQVINSVKNRGTIEINLNSISDKTEVEIELQGDQVKLLKGKDVVLSIIKGDITLEIPSSVFKDSSEKVIIKIEKLKQISNALSTVYDFTIEQNGKFITKFDQGITLHFEVDASKEFNPNNAKVFYWNESTDKWELVGGTYQDGTVSVTTNHFSTYAVFETNTEEASSQSVIETPEKKENTELPSTASHTFNWLLLGSVLLIMGLGVLVIKRRRQV